MCTLRPSLEFGNSATVRNKFDKIANSNSKVILLTILAELLIKVIKSISIKAALKLGFLIVEIT